MKVKITKLKKAETALIGMRVPKQSYGNIGRITDAVMEQEGYALNYGKGPDIPKFGIEKKTKGSQSKSSYSIGSMTYDDIKNTHTMKVLSKQSYNLNLLSNMIKSLWRSLMPKYMIIAKIVYKKL